MVLWVKMVGFKRSLMVMRRERQREMCERERVKRAVNTRGIRKETKP